MFKDVLKKCVGSVLFVSLGWAAVSSSADFYVAPDGSDTNPGTEAAPFATLTQARDAVRQVNADMQKDVHVYLRNGIYPVKEAITFTPRDSGTNGHRIIYEAYLEESPVLSGATPVTGWTQHKGRIYKARLDHPAKLRSLFVNGKRAYMASDTADAQGTYGEYEIRKGQADWAWIGGSSAEGVVFNARDVPALKNAGDVEIRRETKFNSHIIGVEAIGKKGQDRVFKLQQPGGAIALHQKWGGYHPKGRHAIVNAFEYLDTPGEFYFDREDQTVYYYAKGEDMATAEVYAPRIESLIAVQGESTTERVRNLSFIGLTFAYTESVLPKVGDSEVKTTVQAATWCVAFDDPDWHATKYRGYDTMPNVLSVSSAKSISVRDNVFKHIGNEGIGMINDVVDSEVVGNLLYDVGGSAIQIGHPQHVYIGDGGPHAIYKKGVEGVVKDVLVENNVMYDMTNMFFGHAGITVYFSDSLKILKNHIQETNYTAVSLGWGWNNFDEESTNGNPTTVCRNNLFNNNRIYHCMNMLKDGGAFYTLGGQPGSEASGNYVKASTTNFQGVYHPDEGTAWYTGKDLVFEIVPGQDTFELNKWRRKHDNHYRNIYSTSSSIKLGAPECTVTDLHVIPDADWPEEALMIIRAAGPDSSYEHLLSVIPDLVYNAAERYDTAEDIVTAGSSSSDEEPPADGNRYEGERGRMLGGARVGTEHKGYSGSGYVEGFYKSDKARVAFSVTAPETGTYDLALRYAAGHKDARDLVLLINGEKNPPFVCPSTGKWDEWKIHAESVFLHAGKNEIVLEARSSSPDTINLDYLQIIE